jgi:hypothetical protein
MAEPVRARRLTDQEGQRLPGDDHHGVGVGDAGAGDRAAGEDTVRDVIRAFNAKGLAALDQ